MKDPENKNKKQEWEVSSSQPTVSWGFPLVLRLILQERSSGIHIIMIVLQPMDIRPIRTAEDFAIQRSTTTQPVQRSDSVCSKTQKPKTPNAWKILYQKRTRKEWVLKQILIILLSIPTCRSGSLYPKSLHLHFYSVLAVCCKHKLLHIMLKHFIVLS